MEATPAGVSPSEHFNQVAFLFVPNVCNAKCTFCYVSPTYAHSARIPQLLLQQTRQLLEGLADQGFKEIRFTGGEPLVFENFGELVAQTVASGLEYRVLTNGLNLARFRDLFHEFPPARIVISVHDLAAQSAVFGVPVDTNALLTEISSIRELCPVEATIVIQDRDPDGLIRTMRELARVGVTDVKLLIANVPDRRYTLSEFHSLAREAKSTISSGLRVRYSDVESHTCRLKQKGFLSIDIASMRAHSCCVQVGADPAIVGPHVRDFTVVHASDELTSTLAALTLADSRVGATLPCVTHYKACPIALRD